MLQHVFEFIIFPQEFQSGLFAHAGDAGDVIRRIAHQSLEIGHLIGTHAVAFDKLFRRKILDLAQTLARKPNARVIPDELKGIAVTRDQYGLRALLRRAA